MCLSFPFFTVPLFGVQYYNIWFHWYQSGTWDQAFRINGTWDLRKKCMHVKTGNEVRRDMENGEKFDY